MVETDEKHNEKINFVLQFYSYGPWVGKQTYTPIQPLKKNAPSMLNRYLIGWFLILS